MIANITTGRRAQNMILYNEKKVSLGQAEKLSASTPVMLNKMAAIDVLNEYGKKVRTTDTMVQITLSLPIGENLNNDDFNKIANEYLHLAGFLDTPFVIYRHHDTQHEHLHICTSLVNHDGKKIDTYYQYIQSQKATRALEIKYGLQMVSSFKTKGTEVETLGKDYDVLREELSAKGTSNRAEQRKAIAKASRLILDKLKPTTLPELRKIYAQMGIEMKEVKDELDKHAGYVFRVDYLKEKTFVNASDLSFTFDQSTLESKFKKNLAAKFRSKPSRIISSIRRLQRNFEKISTTDFIAELESKSIVPIYDRYSDNKAYGLSFMDKNTGFIYKGSDLGKGFSFNDLKNFTSDHEETKLTLESMLYEATSKLYTEFRLMGIPTPMLSFIQMEDTRSNLIIELKDAIPNVQIEKVVDDYIQKRKTSLEQNKEFVEAKGLVMKCLNEYYNKTLKTYLTIDKLNSPVSFVLDYLEENKTDILAYIKDNEPKSSLFKAEQLEIVIDDFIHHKQNSEPLKPLVEDVSKQVSGLIKAFVETIETTGEQGGIISLMDNKEHICKEIKPIVMGLLDKDITKMFTKEVIDEHLNKLVQVGYNKALQDERRKIVRSRIEDIVKNIQSNNGTSFSRLDRMSSFVSNAEHHKNDLLGKPILGLSQSDLGRVIDLEIQKIREIKIPFLLLNKNIQDQVESSLAQCQWKDDEKPAKSPFFIDVENVKALKNTYSEYQKVFGNENKFCEFIDNQILDTQSKVIAKEVIEGKLEDMKAAFLRDNPDLKFVDYINHLSAKKEKLFAEFINEQMANMEPYFRFDIAKHQSFLLQITEQWDNKLSYISKVQMPMINLAEEGRSYIKSIQQHLKNNKASPAEMYEFFSTTTNRERILANILENHKKNGLYDLVADDKKSIDKLIKGHSKVLDFYANTYMNIAQQMAEANLNRLMNQGVDFVADLFDAKDNKPGLNSARNDRKKKKKGPKYD